MLGEWWAERLDCMWPGSDLLTTKAGGGENGRNEGAQRSGAWERRKVALDDLKASRHRAWATWEPSRGRKWPIPRPQHVDALQHVHALQHEATHFLKRMPAVVIASPLMEQSVECFGGMVRSRERRVRSNKAFSLWLERNAQVDAGG